MGLWDASLTHERQSKSPQKPIVSTPPPGQSRPVGDVTKGNPLSPRLNREHQNTYRQANAYANEQHLLFWGELRLILDVSSKFASR